MEATQIANGEGCIHPEERFIRLRSAVPRTNPRGTGGYIGKKRAMVKARFSVEVSRLCINSSAAVFSSRDRTSYFAGAARSRHRESATRFVRRLIEMLSPRC